MSEPSALDRSDIHLEAGRSPAHFADWLWPIALVIAVTLLSFIAARSSVDLAAIREAARQGTLDALAENAAKPSAANPSPAASVGNWKGIT